MILMQNGRRFITHSPTISTFQRIFEKPSSDIFSLLTVSDNELWSPIIFFLFENKVVDI